ncbi:MAG: thioredoxin domain-containing protein [Deltaproteobacteria bacterium]|nr:thioredoxin domain-containing protein [Deltaproteobacteria bacterium]
MKQMYFWLVTNIMMLSGMAHTNLLYGRGSDLAPAFEIYGQKTTMDQLIKQEKDKFYRLEKEKYQLIEGMARAAYLDAHWSREGKKKGISGDKAREQYMDQQVRVSDKEIRETLEKYKSHPKLKELSQKEQEEQIKNLLRMRGEQEVLQKLLDEGEKSGGLKILATRPEEPVYDVRITKDDHVRFGPGHADIRPVPGGCKGDDCAITVVEYSEFQCPFCSRVLPAVKKLLTDYKGKIRWIVRDFPLSFHDRARPAAIAAKCASYQSPEKYWAMYDLLFENQQSLSEADLERYASEIKLDMDQYKACRTNSQKAEAMIDHNIQSGAAVGVSGTPAFIVNGTAHSGALPYEEFRRIFEEKLQKKSS